MAVNLSNRSIDLSYWTATGDGDIEGFNPTGNSLPTGSPTITGTVAVGNTLTCNTASIADADGLGAFSYQWNADGVPISGATSSTYALTIANIDDDITVTVSYTDGKGTVESITSDSTGRVPYKVAANDSTYIGMVPISWPTIGDPRQLAIPSQPAEWPSAEAAGYYYIDPTHPSATDSGNTYGYPDKPRVNVPNKTFSAGDYVEIGGDYTGNRIPKFAGTAANPCFFVCLDSSINITAKFNLSGSTYLIVDGFNVNWNYANSNTYNNVFTIGGVADSSYICIRNCVVEKIATTVRGSIMNVNPSNGYVAHDIVFWNNRFYDIAGQDYANWQSFDLDLICIAASIYTRDTDSGVEIYNIWVVDCYATNVSGNLSLWVGQSTTGTALPQTKIHNLYTHGCEGHHNRQTLMWTKEASNVVTTECVAWGNRNAEGGQGDGIGYQYSPDMVFYMFNEFYDLNFGFRCSEGLKYTNDHRTFLIGNVFYDCQPFDSINDFGITGGAGIFYMRGSDAASNKGKRYCAFNTVYSCKYGIAAAQDATDLYTWSNLLLPINTEDASGIYHKAIGTNMASNYTSDYDFFADEASFRTLFGATTDTSIANWRTTSGQDANATYGTADLNNPSTDPSLRDFTLKVTSDAIDAGTINAPDTLDVFALYQTTFGVDVEKDIQDAARTSGAAPDAGAYEYV